MKAENTAVAEFATAEIAIAHFITATGFRELPPNLSWDDYGRWMGAIGIYKGALMWALGDLLLYGESRWPDIYAQVADATGYDPGTLEQAYSLCKAYPYANRHKAVGWTVHQAAKPLPPEQRDKWLLKAQDGQWTREQLREEIRLSQGREKQSGPGRPRKVVEAEQPLPPRKPDPEAIRTAVREVKTRLRDTISLATKFLAEAEALDLDLNTRTSPGMARKLASAITKLRDKAQWLAQDLTVLERHAIAVAEYVPPKSP